MLSSLPPVRRRLLLGCVARAAGRRAGRGGAGGDRPGPRRPAGRRRCRRTSRARCCWCPATAGRPPRSRCSPGGCGRPAGTPGWCRCPATAPATWPSRQPRWSGPPRRRSTAARRRWTSSATRPAGWWPGCGRPTRGAGRWPAGWSRSAHRTTAAASPRWPARWRPAGVRRRAGSWSRTASCSTRLNTDETPDGPAWVSVWTTQDQIVTPPESARLDGAVNIPVQGVCADAVVGHGELPTDRLVQGLVLAALAPAPVSDPDAGRLRPPARLSQVRTCPGRRSLPPDRSIPAQQSDVPYGAHMTTDPRPLAVVSLSGGMDSTTLMAHYAAGERPHRLLAVSVDYGQRHIRELDSARAVAAHYAVEHLVVDLRAVGTLLSGSALTDPSVDVPEGHYAWETMKATVVPNRNMIIASVLVGLGGVPPGARWSRSACTPVTTPSTRTAGRSSSARSASSPRSPTRGSTRRRWRRRSCTCRKTDIARRGAELGAPLHLSWSCYKGGDVHCGVCGTCYERREAFQDAGVPDPTAYARHHPVRGGGTVSGAHHAVKLLHNAETAHRLPHLGGKCTSLHGHSWQIQVTASFPALRRSIGASSARSRPACAAGSTPTRPRADARRRRSAGAGAGPLPGAEALRLRPRARGGRRGEAGRRPGVADGGERGDPAAPRRRAGARRRRARARGLGEPGRGPGDRRQLRGYGVPGPVPTGASPSRSEVRPDERPPAAPPDAGAEPSADVLYVADVFGPTFQGEGPSTGRLALFVRLGGCNLHCTWCDTGYTWDAARWDLREQIRPVRWQRLVERLAAAVPPGVVPLLVVTGGEPLGHQGRPAFRQPAGGGRRPRHGHRGGDERHPDPGARTCPATRSSTCPRSSRTPATRPSCGSARRRWPPSPSWRRGGGRGSSSWSRRCRSWTRSAGSSPTTSCRRVRSG